MVFELWTTPSHLVKWWGPADVRCTHAEVDLRPGGDYLIVNELPDGSLVRIAGRFERVVPPVELVSTWRVEPTGAVAPPDWTERVAVRFERSELGTELLVRHERIPDEATRASHAHGWLGCLDGLAEYVHARST